MTSRLAPTSRHAYLSTDGRSIYEWDQTVDEINVYITSPPGVTAKALAVTIGVSRLAVGIKGNPPYLDHTLSERVLPDDSTWTLEGGEIAITLCKQARGRNWPCVFEGHEPLDAVSAQKEQQRLLLERFQEENPGFDFSGAEFNGSAPQPDAFMGGMKTDAR
ncbi:hypothetical protein PPROV_000681900 [Pycnococcus provasolii]|uniref:CS domain-containing protein n=1 Tax=Pycnococcus provasolii TaxID=41880 RepID=A0A830HSZ2_9CHLO|nr:hypothetical protein PPROV_000681900 [Pycnococcus provasolii]